MSSKRISSATLPPSMCASLSMISPRFTVGAIDHDLTVEPAGTQQGRIEDIGAVGGRDHDDALVGLEPVHLDEQLVQGLLAFVVTAAHAGATMSAHRVDLVHEDDEGLVLLGLLEEVPNPAGANTHKHLHEVGAGDAEERHAGLAGDGPREQRLAGARRTEEQHALGYTGAQRLEALGILEELLDLL